MKCACLTLKQYAKPFGLDFDRIVHKKLILYLFWKVSIYWTHFYNENGLPNTTFKLQGQSTILYSLLHALNEEVWSKQLDPLPASKRLFILP